MQIEGPTHRPAHATRTGLIEYQTVVTKTLDKGSFETRNPIKSALSDQPSMIAWTE